MIVPGYSLSATERVLPRLALDFTTGILDPRVTLTRALNTATVINSSGLVAIVNANLPRFDYDPVTLAPKGLLVEEARTNIAVQSANFNTVNWALTNASLTTGISDPAGGTSAATLTATSASAAIQQAQLGTAGATYSASFWIKRRTGAGQISLRCGDLTLIPITVTSSWVRYSVAAVASTTTVRIAVVLATSGDAVDIYGAQLEAGAFATSYIPTTTISLTRNADVASMTGTNFSSWYNPSEGTFEVTGITSPRTTSAAVAEHALEASSTLRMVRGAGSVSLGWNVGSTTFQSFGVSTAKFPFKSVAAYKATSNAASLNGGAPLIDAGSTYGTPTSLGIGCNAGGGQQFNGHIKSVRYWPQRVINAETQAFSK